MTYNNNLTNFVKTLNTKERELALVAQVGSHNYNLNTENSDEDYKVFVLPSFDDLYEGTKHKSNVCSDIADYSAHDVRQLSHLLYKANISFLEILFSNNYQCFNPGMSKVFEMRDEIAVMNLPYFYSACLGIYYETMKKFTIITDKRKDSIEKFGYSTKDAAQAYRVLNTLVRFAKNDFENFGDALRFTGDELCHIELIRKGHYSKEELTAMITEYKETNVDTLRKTFITTQINEKTYAKLDSIIRTMIHNHMHTLIQ